MRSALLGLLLTFCLATATPYASAESAPGYNLGMEIELTPQKLSSLMGYFDFEELKNRLLQSRSKIGSNDLLDLLAENLGNPLTQAKIAIEAGSVGYVLKLKPGPVPAFLQNVQWHTDNSLLEFTHAKPYQDQAAFLASVHAFARAAGVADLIDHPTGLQYETENSFHYHVSTSVDRDLRPIAVRENKVLLLRLLRAGDTRCLQESETKFRSYLSRIEETQSFGARGILRIAPRTKSADGRRASLGKLNRYELRKHFASVREESTWVLSHLAMPEAQSIALLDQDIRTLLTPEVKREILRLRASIIADFAPYLAPGELDHYTDQMSLIERIQAWSKLDMSSPRLQAKISKFLTSVDPRVRMQAAHAFQDVLINSPHAFNEMITYAARKHPGESLAEGAVEAQLKETIEAWSRERSTPDWAIEESLRALEASTGRIKFDAAVGAELLLNSDIQNQAYLSRITTLARAHRNPEVRRHAEDILAQQRLWAQHHRAQACMRAKLEAGSAHGTGQ